MINRIRVGDKFTFGYTPAIVMVTVTSIEVMRSAATGDVTTLMRYTSCGNPGCMDDRGFIRFLDDANASRIEKE